MDKKVNFFNDTPDFRFFLEKRCDFKQLFAWLDPEDREAVGAQTPEDYINAWMEVLETIGEISGSTIAPNQRAVEAEDPTLEDNGSPNYRV